MKYFFLVGANTVEGVSPSVIADEIASICRETGYDYSIFHAGFSGEEEEIVRRLVNKHPDRPLRIVICGTLVNLHFGANGAVGAPGIEIGYWPSDGENPFLGDFSSDRKIANTLPEKSVDVDLIKINERYCIGGAVLGFDPGIENIRKRLLAWKKILSPFRIPENAFLRLDRIVSSLLHSSTKSVRFLVNGHEAVEEDILYALFANIRKPAEGYPALSRARIDDGLIDLLFVKKMPLRTVSAFGWPAHHEGAGDEGMQNEIIHRQCLTVEVELAEPSVMLMDGTRYLYDSRFHIAIRPAALKMLIPEPVLSPRAPLAARTI